MKNVKFLFVLMILAFSGVAMGDETTCSDPAGDLHYYESRYSGGPQPMIGMVVHSIIWSYRNAVLGMAQEYYLRDSTPLMIDASFDESSRVTLESKTNGPWQGTEVYAIKASVNVPNKVVETSFMLCTYTWMRNAP